MRASRRPVSSLAFHFMHSTSTHDWASERSTRWRQQSPSIRACLQQYVPRRRWIAAGQHAAFYAEGSAVSRRLHWAQSRSLEALGIEAELSTADVRPDGVEPLIGAIRCSLDQLNAIRTHLLLTVGSDAG